MHAGRPIQPGKIVCSNGSYCRGLLRPLTVSARPIRFVPIHFDQNSVRVLRLGFLCLDRSRRGATFQQLANWCRYRVVGGSRGFSRLRYVAIAIVYC
jgi:hypothetical protein